jgi:hypothetical protein
MSAVPRSRIVLVSTLMAAAPWMSGGAAAQEDPGFDSYAALGPYTMETVSSLPPPALDSQGAEKRHSRLSLQLMPSAARPLGAMGSPSLDIALQWRPVAVQGQQIDITAWHRITPAPAFTNFDGPREANFGARIELAIASAKSRPFKDSQFLGLQLDNGAKIMLRRKNGNPTLYYRVQF